MENRFQSKLDHLNDEITQLKAENDELMPLKETVKKQETLIHHLMNKENGKLLQ